MVVGFFLLLDRRNDVPTYDYRCPTGHQFSEVRAITAATDANCPTCQEAGQRVFTAPPIVFKGEGFNTANG